MTITNTPIAGQRTLLRRQSNGDFVPNLPQPTTPEEARLYQETLERAEQAEKFLENFQDEFSEVRQQDNTKDDLNTTPGVVATSKRVFRSSVEDVTTSTVLTFDPVSKAVVSYQNRSDGRVHHLAGKAYNETLEQTASAVFTASPFLLSTDHRLVVVDEPTRTSHYQESIRALGDGLYEYITAASDALTPKDRQF